MIIVVIFAVVMSSIKLSGAKNLVREIYDKESSRDKSIASGLISELLTSDSGSKSTGAVAASLLTKSFKLQKFAVFIRENDKYIPRIYGGLRPSDLNRPRSSRIRTGSRELDNSGCFSDPSYVFRALLKTDDWQYFDSPIAFCHRWGRHNSLILIADNGKGLISDVLKDREFNKSFWPVLSAYTQFDSRLGDLSSENNHLKKELSGTRRDITNLHKELNSKLHDLHSYVKISGELYSIFNENQLFENLKKTVSTRLGARSAEILCSDGSGKFVNCTEDENRPPNFELSTDSAFFNLLRENPKPVLLPIAASGLENGDPFLEKAMAKGIQIGAGIVVENKMACILLIAEKSDKGRYSDSDLDFLSTIINIASLSLENIRQYTTIEKLSYTDSMTGVYNYRYFYKRLIEEILRAKRYNRELSLVILDIDNFKLFNDKYGHQTGDLVLKRMAGIITETVRSIDVVSRYGGEEFCIIMPDTNAENCEIFIERLRSEIAGFKLDSGALKDDNVITVSVGGAVYPRHSASADRLIYNADMALLKAKASGRNKAVMFQAEFVDKEESSIGGGL